MLLIYAWGNMNSSILTALWYERTLFILPTQCVHITLHAGNMNTFDAYFQTLFFSDFDTFLLLFQSSVINLS